MKLDRPLDLPSSLEDRFELVRNRASELDRHLPQALRDEAARVLVTSEFVMTALERCGDALLARVLEAGPLTADYITGATNIESAAETAAMARLRKLREIEMARVAWRDIAGLDDLETTLADLSLLAEELIRQAVAYAIEHHEPRFGRPVATDDKKPTLLVLAMGKLGGSELNFSSDVDLVFLYPDDAVIGDLTGMDLQPYFLRVAQQVIRLLDQRTADGIVFRTDTRLRPFGASGPLVVSVSAFESYLISHGRDWERYAYQKARLITGQDYRAEVFDEILVPYVYRGYVDYGVFEALRQMKQRIRQEVLRRDMAENIKLGPGGIREIEFIVQAFQLIRGGRDQSLRRRSLLAMLPRIVEERQLRTDDVDRLGAAYRFLRRLENRLQQLQDKQTHVLPSDNELRSRLAYGMRLDGWTALEAELGRQRDAVAAAFDKVVYFARGAPLPDSEWETIRSAWDAGMQQEDVAGLLPQLSDDAARILRELRTGALYRRMDETSRVRLAAVVIRTIAQLPPMDEQAAALNRLVPVLQAICRRSAYLALLNENPASLERLMLIARRSSLLSRQLADQPILLDELLDPRIFDSPPTRDEFRRLLADQLAGVATDDTEASLDALRQFHSAAVFRVAVADMLGRLPLMNVSDRLTDTAELTVKFALELAYKELCARYGRPRCGEAGDLRDAGFAVVAYGKLAGLELGYGSDLDLVFLHDSTGSHQQTDGRRSIDNATFFIRLAQRLIHFLSIQTVAGRLYEIDTRLRPSGQSGLLVVSLDKFERYQRSDAWVWEHQALLRSRAIAGSKEVCAEFEQLRTAVLINAVDRRNLAREVTQMRERMQSELSKSGPSQFDLKQDSGGLADIEFLVDYLVLANASEKNGLVTYPDNVRQLETLERAGLLSTEDCAVLKRCYLSLRQRVHERALDGQDRIVDSSELRKEREQVQTIWRRVFG